MTPLSWLGIAFYSVDGGLATAILARTEYGQIAVGVIVAFVGFVLNRRTKKIQVNVDGRLGKALTRLDVQDARIAQLEATIRLSDKDVPEPTKATA